MLNYFFTHLTNVRIAIVRANLVNVTSLNIFCVILAYLLSLHLEMDTVDFNEDEVHKLSLKTRYIAYFTSEFTNSDRRQRKSLAPLLNSTVSSAGTSKAKSKPPLTNCFAKKVDTGIYFVLQCVT